LPRAPAPIRARALSRTRLLPQILSVEAQIGMRMKNRGFGEPFSGKSVQMACRVARPLGGSDRVFLPANGAFTSGLSTGRSPLPPPDITTVATGQFHRWAFHPLEQQLASPHLGLHRTTASSAPPRRFIPAHLFIAQRNRWVYFSGPPGRKVTSQQRSPNQEQCHSAEGQWIGGGDAKEKGLDSTRQGE